MTERHSGSEKLFKVVALNCRYTHSCLALFHVREELRSHLPDSRVEICQLTINDPYYQTLLHLAAENPAVVLFSVYVWNSVYTLRLARDLIRMLPEVQIVLGGPEASHMPYPPLEKRCTLVRGEVEGLAAAFFADLASGNLRAEYLAEVSPSFVSPYRGTDFAAELKNRQIYYESTRGCPFACTYCLSSISRGMRSKDLTLVKIELAEILKHRPLSLRFVDRTFNADSWRTLDLWRFLIEQPAETEFHFEIAPDRISEEMFGFLATIPPGRFAFEMGIQSTNAETLAAINRRLDMTRIADNIRRLKTLDTVHLHSDLILGLPFETAETFRKTFNEVFVMGAHHVQMGLLKILPGTPISQEREWGIIHCSEPPYEVMANRWLDQQTLARFYWFGDCVEAFHNNRFFLATLDYIRRTEPDAFAFFDCLLDLALDRGFQNRAKTQDFLNSLLCEIAAGRQDYELMLDLLRFDWLKSGHQFLPEVLTTGMQQTLRATRDRLWKHLPPNLPPFFVYQGREEFFKQGVFFWFSGETLREAGLSHDGTGGNVCFLPTLTSGAVKTKTAVLLPETG